MRDRHASHRTSLIRGASPLGLPDTLASAPRRRRPSASARSATARPRRSLGGGGPVAWLARVARSRSVCGIRSSRVDGGTGAVAGLHAVAGTSQGRLGVGVHRTRGLARDADPTMADRRRARLCHTARRGRPPVRVLTTRRQRGHERPGRGNRQDDLGDPDSRVVHDEHGRCASRAGTEIDAGLRGWEAVRDRHDRCDLRLRRKDGKGALAKAGLGAGADVHDARVLADCRSRAGDLSPGRPQQGRHHGVRRHHGSDEVELGMAMDRPTARPSWRISAARGSSSR